MNHAGVESPLDRLRATDAPTVDHSVVEDVQSLREECLAIARHLVHLEKRQRRGDIAALRRMAERIPGVLPPDAFWTLVQVARIAQEREEFWEQVVPYMCVAVHRPGVDPGRAMRVVGISSSRIERWLRLSKPSAISELRRLVRRMDTLDWVAMSSLLKHWNEGEKRQFARSYFLRPRGESKP